MKNKDISVHSVDRSQIMDELKRNKQQKVINYINAVERSLAMIKKFNCELIEEIKYIKTSTQ